MTKTTGTILDEIVAARRRQVAEDWAHWPLEQVQAMAERRKGLRDFTFALRHGSALAPWGVISVIGELKRASPSRGLLRQQYRRREIARGYEIAGASALSVLTEKQFFMGSLDDLAQVRQAVELPVLRKDFLLEEYQIYESAAAGADALLLIAAVLSDYQLENLVALAHRLCVEPVVEVHTEDEVYRALDSGAWTIGVNNRNLKTMEVDLNTSFRLRRKIPSTCVAISESGIKEPEDLVRLRDVGYHAVLVGEHFMTSSDPGLALGKMVQDAKAYAKAYAKTGAVRR